jgi:hypothetical protein
MSKTDEEQPTVPAKGNPMPSRRMSRRRQQLELEERQRSKPEQLPASDNLALQPGPPYRHFVDDNPTAET